MQETDQTVRKLKLVVVSLIMTIAGALLLLLARYVEATGNWRWLSYLPVFELGSTLFITGTLVLAYDYFDARDKERRDDARIRRLLHEAAPDFRDAVVKGFAVSPEDLARVATPDMLDSIATNALSLRLGDHQFASEIYADLRDQAIRAPERWHDAQVRVRLSTAVERGAGSAPLFDVLVEWEYTTVPTHPVQRFACVSDRNEFHELVTDVPATLTWLMTPRSGLAARDRRNYELLAFTVDGVERKIRRTERATGQTYSASLDEKVVRAGEPVRIRQLYRAVTPRSGHRLYFEVGQPTRQFSIEVDYTDTDIAHMSVTELVSSSHRSQVSQLPKQVEARVLGVDLPGWLLPKSGFAFVWTLASEQTTATGERAGASDPAKSA